MRTKTIENEMKQIFHNFLNFRLSQTICDGHPSFLLHFNYSLTPF